MTAEIKLKVKLSKDEIYEVQIPTVLSGDQFLGLMNRFKVVEKLLSRDLVKEILEEEAVQKVAVKNNNDNKVKKIKHANQHSSEYITMKNFDTEEKAVKLFNDFYTSVRNKNEASQFATKIGFRNLNAMKVAMTHLKQKYKLKNSNKNKI